MENLNNEIKDTIQSIDQVADLLYQRNITEGYKNLDKVLALLSSTINDICQYQEKGIDFGIEEKNIEEVLNTAMKAIEEKDEVLLADILHYDVIELLEKAKRNIK